MSDEVEIVDAPDVIKAPDVSPEPKPKSKAEIELECLKVEADEAAQEVLRLKGEASEGLRMYEAANAKLPEAKARCDAALDKLYEVKPKPLPPLPSHAEMLAMARRQCPDRDANELKVLAARMHASASDRLARASENYYKTPEPTMSGPEVHAVADHHYDLKPRERKSYG